MDKLGNETHLMINITKNITKKQTGIHLVSKRFSSLERLGSGSSNTKLCK